MCLLALHENKHPFWLLISKIGTGAILRYHPIIAELCPSAQRPNYSGYYARIFAAPYLGMKYEPSHNQGGGYEATQYFIEHNITNIRHNRRVSQLRWYQMAGLVTVY